MMMLLQGPERQYVVSVSNRMMGGCVVFFGVQGPRQAPTTEKRMENETESGLQRWFTGRPNITLRVQGPK